MSPLQFSLHLQMQNLMRSTLHSAQQAKEQPPPTQPHSYSPRNRKLAPQAPHKIPTQSSTSHWTSRGTPSTHTRSMHLKFLRNYYYYICRSFIRYLQLDEIVYDPLKIDDPSFPEVDEICDEAVCRSFKLLLRQHQYLSGRA